MSPPATRVRVGSLRPRREVTTASSAGFTTRLQAGRGPPPAGRGSRPRRCRTPRRSRRRRRSTDRHRGVRRRIGIEGAEVVDAIALAVGPGQAEQRIEDAGIHRQDVVEAGEVGALEALATPSSVTPRRFAAARARASAGSPVCQSPVPRLSIEIRSSSPASRTSFLKMPSAVGERQMLPRQTKHTATGPFEAIGGSIASVYFSRG